MKRLPPTPPKLLPPPHYWAEGGRPNPLSLWQRIARWWKWRAHAPLWTCRCADENRNGYYVKACGHCGAERPASP